MSGNSMATHRIKPKAGRYLMWSALALVVLIPLWACVLGYVMAEDWPHWTESDLMIKRWLMGSVVVPMLFVTLVAVGQWVGAKAPTKGAGDGSEAAAAALAAAQQTSRDEDVLEVIGLGVTLDKYRQGRLWDALAKGHAYASIREQDPKRYPWSADAKESMEGDRTGASLENGAKATPIYWGVPTFAADFGENPRRPASTTDTQLGVAAGAESSGMAFQLFVSAGWELSDRPDRLMDRIFAFFDEHPDIPYVVVSGADGLYFRDLYRPKGTPRLINDGYYIPEMPDSSVLFVLARRDRVDRIRPFVFEDADEEKYLGEELNRRGFARKLMVAYMDLSERVPKPKGSPKRTPTVAEWLQETQAFAQRDDIYSRHISLLHPLEAGKHPSRDFKPTPWFPIPWNKAQLDAFDKLPTLGFIHRPVFVKTVDEQGQPLTRRDARALALAAGWQAALQTLPEPERQAAPARVVVGSGSNIDQTVALHTVMSNWAQAGGPELNASKSTQWIDTDARLGNTGAATWFMQMAIGVMGSYKEGGASVAINLRDPGEASIVFITPPSDEQRKRQHNAAGGDVWRSIVGPAIDPDNYKEP